MMWTGELSEDRSEMAVYDHNDDHVTTLEDDESGFGYQDVRDAAFDRMEGNQPSVYNQQLIACMACNQIEITFLGEDNGDPS